MDQDDESVEIILYFLLNEKLIHFLISCEPRDLEAKALLLILSLLCNCVLMCISIKCLIAVRVKD